MSAERWCHPAAIRRAAAVLGPSARLDAALGSLTTSRVGGPAAVAFTARGPHDLARASQAGEASGLPILVVGRGSNLLVADRGFEGIALWLGGRYSRLHLDRGNCTVTAGAATALPVLARRSAAAGIGGLEWAVGIPGSVGGAVRMNAGGHGADIASCLIDVELADLVELAESDAVAAPSAASAPTQRLAARALGLGYRCSALPPGQVVVSARLQGRPSEPAAAAARIAEIVRWRRDNQPGGNNAGSVFMNPPDADDSAGAQIDRAGLRGLRIGTAEVSRRHANFIVSDPGGTAADVAALMAEIRRRVADMSGTVLQPEIRMVGFAASAIPA